MELIAISSVLKPQQARTSQKCGHPHQVDMLKWVTNKIILPALPRKPQAPNCRVPLRESINNRPDIEQKEI